MLVSRSIHVVDLKVALHLGLVNLEEEVLLGDDFSVGIGSEDFRVDLFLKFNKLKLLFNDAVNASFDFFDGLSIIVIDYLGNESVTVFVLILQGSEVCGVFASLLGSEGVLVSRVLPQSLSLDVSSVLNI
jgi:hypothetical protein